MYEFEVRTVAGPCPVANTNFNRGGGVSGGGIFCILSVSPSVHFCVVGWLPERSIARLPLRISTAAASPPPSLL